MQAAELSRRRITTLLDERDLNYSMNSDFYTDPKILRQERERIFARHWWLLGPAQVCENAGDYLSDTICGWPVYAIRGDDGKLRAFHNVCRHRGAQLLAPGSGNCGTVRCPYHSWQYATDGRLLRAPRFGDEQINAGSCDLFDLECRVWQGMIFICPASGQGEPAIDFDQWLGSLPRLIESFDSIDSMEYHGSFVVEGHANWKTYCDNTVEGYHLHSVHPRLAKAVASGNVEIASYDDGALVAFHVGYGEAASAAKLRGDAGIWTYKFPGFQLAISDNAFKIERLEPIAIDRLRSTNWAWYRNLSVAEREDSFAWSRTVVEEDIGICETVQVNLAAGVYRNGPLSPAEEPHVATLQRYYRSELGADENGSDLS